MSIHGPPGRLDGHEAGYHITDHVPEDMIPNFFSLQLEAVLPKLGLQTKIVFQSKLIILLVLCCKSSALSVHPLYIEFRELNLLPSSGGFSRLSHPGVFY
jgi:hypothetical protein